MTLNKTPSANRIHIGFFGCRNAGKSSLVNAITGQTLSIVSDIKGTTTDPVMKSMELLPLGPVLIIDTPGLDDEGELGMIRIQKAKQILRKTDIAVLVVDGTKGLTKHDRHLISVFTEKKIPYLIAYNKCDIDSFTTENDACNSIAVSALAQTNIQELKEQIGTLLQTSQRPKHLIGDLVSPGSLVVLVTPIDESAPKGRLILPQQQVIRDLLDIGAIAVVTKETELQQTLNRLSDPPALVITDSQVFETVAAIVPEIIPLTSFSILMARYKGFLDTASEAVFAIDHLKCRDTVLIAEGCTHHRQCNDIGTVKIPHWLRSHTNSEITIDTCSGTEFPEDLSKYSVVIHCGGCMLNGREMQYRMTCAANQNVPFTNYGILIAHMKGILKRSLEIFQ